MARTANPNGWISTLSCEERNNILVKTLLFINTKWINPKKL